MFEEDLIFNESKEYIDNSKSSDKKEEIEINSYK